MAAKKRTPKKATRAQVNRALERGTKKIMRAAMAGEYIAGLEAGFRIAIQATTEELLTSAELGPISVLAAIGDATRKAIAARRDAANAST